MSKIKILLVEDDETTAKWLNDFLEDRNFIIEFVSTITDAISYIKNNNFDIVILDLNLPDFHGFELLKSIRNVKQVPIIVVSAYNDTQTKVQAFKYGAMDYMTKPIDFEELEARIWSVLSRVSNVTIENEKTFKIENNTIYFNNQPINLTTIEFKILETLINKKNQVVSRDDLSQTVSSDNSSRTLDYHIKNIRIKLNKIQEKNMCLQTEYGLGYKLIF